MEDLHLNFFGAFSPLTVTCLELTFQRLTKLRALKFETNGNVQQLQPLLPSLSYLNQLREIVLSYNHWVNDETLRIISRSCSYLECIDVAYCSDITDSGLIHVSKLKYLTHLKLNGCHNITDDGVKLLAKLDGLEVLNLCDCRNVTDDSVIKIAEDLPKLVELNLRNTGVTNASVLAFYNKAVGKKTVKLKLYVDSTKVFLEKSRRNYSMVLICR